MSGKLTFITPFYSTGLTEALHTLFPVYIGDTIVDCDGWPCVATRVFCCNKDRHNPLEWIDVPMEKTGWTHEGLLQTFAVLFNIPPDQLSSVTLFVGSDEIYNRIIRPGETVLFADDPVFDVVIAPPLY